VDLTGRPAVHGWRDAGLYDTWILRDACQSIGATYNGQSSAKLSHIAAYSLHPLKNIHACGDGGMIVTDNDDWAEWMRLYRNHGLADRDHVTVAGINSRLDTLQAIAAWHLLEELECITARRNANARQYRQGLEALAPEVLLPPLDPPGSSVRQAYHTFVVQVSERERLMAFLADRGIESKIHYPIPIHLQKGYEFLGYRRGSLPKAEAQADRILSLPVHEYLTESQIEYVVDSVRTFYAF
jgi:dTDP-4-amino-4,6-dideoxygalactose transaminase